MTQTTENLYQQAHQFLLQSPPDYAQAAQLLQLAAKSGHSEAAFQLTACLINGHGIAVDFAAGVEYLKQAARAGHVYARYNLLQLQESENADIQTLLPHYIELAEQGLVHAQLRLMRAFNEMGQAQQALLWANKAAEQNHPQAQYFVAQYHQYAAEPDLYKAHQLYRLAAEQGFVAAHWQLGLQYKLAQGVAKDLTQARAHLQVAAQHGIAPAQTALAEILLPQNSVEALTWFQTAAENGDNDAHAALAEIYLLGQDVERDPQKAQHHAEQAAANNHPQALRLLGDIYRYGLGVAAQPQKAREYYRKAADLGDISAHQKLLSDSALNDHQHYEAAKQTALQRQQAESLYQKAFAAHYGLQRSQSYAEALPLYLQVAELGHTKAKTNLGMMYYSGQGVANDFSQAAQWFESAAEQQDTMAQYNLACLYFHGMGVPKNPAKACKWLQQAIDNGHEQADVLKTLLAQWQQAV
ncbi:sel1 repeat family protein [Neisseria brasiliensis]|uniref:tetratricopeptide repeat protein n=1 Tax=Neisseria TaxID=482 RepID=UPI000C27795B|nr:MULTISPECIES: tetratricopeptide repeat protein [Neisseria]PJO77976.1 sel1 repeat family protein [Neisseria sp. N177_16]QGL26136.1 sel1 repeat family protein [Neisseria brasiliensis]